MGFICLFDLLDFDNDTKSVKATSSKNLEQARSNFLYLTSKYNQRILREKRKGDKVEIPEFFKKDLKRLLFELENEEGDYKEISDTVIENCEPEIQDLYKNSGSEKEFLIKLGDLISIEDEKFAESLKTAKNEKHLEYIMTAISGRLMDQVQNSIATGGLADDKRKSILFKGIILYNGVIAALNKLEREKYEKSF